MSNGNEASFATLTAICGIAICGGPILFKSAKWVVLAQIRVSLASQKEGSFSLSAKASNFFGARTACKAFKSGVSKSIFDFVSNQSSGQAPKRQFSKLSPGGTGVLGRAGWGMVAYRPYK